MMNWESVSVELCAKLNPAAVKPPKQFGPKGDYIEGWHAIAEANRIFGFDGWSYDVVDCRCVSERPREIGQAKKPGFGVTYTCSLKVTVDCVTRVDVGAGHGYDVDCGMAHESAIKEAVTDALKRALRTFGNPFGLALYDKSRENVGADVPPFDPRAAADVILKRLNTAQDMGALAKTWGASAEIIGEIKSHSAPIFAELNAAKDARKTGLTEQDAADSADADLSGSEIEY